MGSLPLGLPASATFLALLFLLGCAGVATADCSVPLKQLSERPPLLLRPGGPLNVSGFAAPDADHVVRLSANGSLLLACPGPGNQLLFANRTSGFRQVNVTCARDSVVTVRSAEVDLRTVQCLRHAERTAEKDGKRRCGAGARGLRMRIGFRLLTGFLELVAACFDDQLLSPIYSNYTLVHSIAGKRPGGEHAVFRTGGVFGAVSPRRQYELQNQTLQALLGAAWQRTANDSLTRGHLASRAGFVFWPQKRATFFYVNAAPQWRSINGGAWAGVERAARSLAAARGDLLVVTGVYGVTSLPDVHGVSIPLFLFDQGVQRKMPVPALYWKVLYDPRTREGAAVVGSNNPWEPLAAHPELRLCADVCARLRWLPKPMSPEVYCCEVDALRQRVADLPPLEVEALLESATPPRGRSRRKQKAKARGGGGGGGNAGAAQKAEEPPSGWLAVLAADAAHAPSRTPGRERLG
ncbi:hypothetical protein R5R35_003482 [Gryllus longicercus]|uniref:DNA/RNA non-specific endonuclease/pyrophosphatase/phosphodiesterase domain-containing protein n=1 Tax=Gryllus longicercus TaxID=2509291 RepID=A0AAN9VBN1_9ORTH